jgi:hypothetical protein
MHTTRFVIDGATDQQAIDKYRGRGFTMVYRSEDLPGYDPTHKCGQHQCCSKTRRELRDDVTLLIPLEDAEFSIHAEEGIVGWVLQKDYDHAL